MYYNEELDRDIKTLKELRMKHQVKAFRKFRDEIMEKHKLSKRSIYHHLSSETPGLMHTDPKGTAEEIKPKPEINAAQNLLRQMEDDLDKDEVYPSDEDERLIYLASMKIYRDEFSKNILGDMVFLFFKRLLQYGLADYENGIKMSLIDEDFQLTKYDIDDFCLLLANIYNRSAEKQAHIKKDHYLKMKVRNLLEQRLRSQGEDCISFKELDSITRVYKRLESTASGININYIQVICNELKPGITIEEVLHLIKKHKPEMLSSKNGGNLPSGQSIT